MQLEMKGNFEDDFVYKVIPSIIRKKLIGQCNSPKMENMRKYFESLKIGYTILDVINFAVDKMYIGIDGNHIYYNLFTKKKVDGSNYSIEALLNLIEYGNLEVRGSHCIELIFDYIRLNLKYLYSWYKDRYRR